VPEILEVEASRRLLEERALRRRITALDAPDPWYLKRGLDAGALHDTLVGRRFTAARRHGKLLLLDIEPGSPAAASDRDHEHNPVLGLRFGMTGQLFVDGHRALDRLEYASNRPEPAWERLILHFGVRGRLLVRDPRRLGAVELDPDEDRLGVDALALTGPDIDRILGRSRAPLKAVLMDQSRLAGLGNLLTDEVLWRAELDPARRAGALDSAERRRLHRVIARTLRELGARGGSHTGDLMHSREPGGVCPKDGTPLARRTVAGRTTYSCPRHQR